MAIGRLHHLATVLDRHKPVLVSGRLYAVAMFPIVDGPVVRRFVSSISSREEGYLRA